MWGRQARVPQTNFPPCRRYLGRGNNLVLKAISSGRGPELLGCPALWGWAWVGVMRSHVAGGVQIAWCLRGIRQMRLAAHPSLLWPPTAPSNCSPSLLWWHAVRYPLGRPPCSRSIYWNLTAGQTTGDSIGRLSFRCREKWTVHGGRSRPTPDDFAEEGR